MVFAPFITFQKHAPRRFEPIPEHGCPKGRSRCVLLPAPFDEPRGVESLEASGNGAQVLVFQFRRFRHADLAGGKPSSAVEAGMVRREPGTLQTHHRIDGGCGSFGQERVGSWGCLPPAFSLRINVPSFQALMGCIHSGCTVKVAWSQIARVGRLVPTFREGSIASSAASEKRREWCAFLERRKDRRRSRQRADS
jgi:hypothetical protein